MRIDRKGQNAKNWSSFSNKNGKVMTDAALKSLNDEEISFVVSLSEIIHGAAKDLRGTNDDLKYKNIVDLLMKRVEDVVEEHISALNSSYSEDIKEAIKNKLSDLCSNDNVDEYAIIGDLTNKSFDKIDEYFNDKIQFLFDDLNKILNLNKKKENSKEIKIQKKTENKAEKYLISQFDKISKVVNEMSIKVEKLEKNILSTISDIEKKINKDFLSMSQTIDKKINSKLNMKFVKDIFKDINKKLNDITPTKKQRKKDQIYNDLIKAIAENIKDLKNELENIAPNIFMTFLKVLLRPVNLIKILAVVFGLMSTFILSGLIGGYMILKEPFMKAIKPIVDEIKGIQNTISDFIDQMKIKIQPLIDCVKNDIIPIVKKIFVQMKDTMKYVFDLLKNNFKNLMYDFLNLKDAIFNTLSLFFNGIGSRAKDIFKQLLKIVKLYKKILKFFSPFRAIIKIISKRFQQIKDIIYDFIDKFKKGFGNHNKQFEENLGIVKTLFGQTIDNFMKGYNSQKKINPEVQKKYYESLDKCKSKFEIIQNNFGQIQGSLEKINDEFTRGMESEAENIVAQQKLYLEQCAEIDSIYGSCVKDSGGEIAEIQGKIVENLIDIFKYFGNGRIEAMIRKSTLNRLIDSLCFWRDKRIPTPSYINEVVKDKGLKSIEGFKEYKNNFYNAFRHQKVSYRTGGNNTLPQWYDVVLYRMKDMFNNISNFKIIISGGDLPNTTHDLLLKLHKEFDSLTESILGVSDKVAEVFNNEEAKAILERKKSIAANMKSVQYGQNESFENIDISNVAKCKDEIISKFSNIYNKYTDLITLIANKTQQTLENIKNYDSKQSMIPMNIKQEVNLATLDS